MARKVIATQLPPEYQMSPWEYRDPIEGLVIRRDEYYATFTEYGKDTNAARVIELCDEWSGHTGYPDFYKDFIDLLNEWGLSYEKFRIIEQQLDYYRDRDAYCKVLNELVGGNWKHVEGCTFDRKEHADFYYDNNLHDTGFGGIDDIITEFFNDGNEWEVTSYVDGVVEDQLTVYCHNAEDPLLEIAWAISADPDVIEIDLEWYE